MSNTGDTEIKKTQLCIPGACIPAVQPDEGAVVLNDAVNTLP